MDQLVEEQTALKEMTQAVKTVEQESLFDQSAVLLAIVGSIAAIILFVLLLGNKKKRSESAGIEEERELLAKEPEKRKEKKYLVKPPEMLLRAQYQRFMQQTDAGRKRLQNADTTEEIREKYLENVRGAMGKDESGQWMAVKAQAAQELTQLYQKVRYAEEEISKAEAERARKLRKELEE